MKQKQKCFHQIGDARVWLRSYTPPSLTESVMNLISTLPKTKAYTPPIPTARLEQLLTIEDWKQSSHVVLNQLVGGRNTNTVCSANLIVFECDVTWNVIHCFYCEFSEESNGGQWSISKCAFRFVLLSAWIFSFLCVNDEHSVTHPNVWLAEACQHKTVEGRWQATKINRVVNAQRMTCKFASHTNAAWVTIWWSPWAGKLL